MDQNGSFVSPYMSPQAAAAQREYAKALMYGSGDKGPQFKDVHSWTQGVSNMVNALMGGNAMHGADMSDRGAMTASYGTPPGTPAPPQAKPSFDEGPTSEGQTNSDDGNIHAAAPIKTAGLDPRGMEPYIRDEASKYGVDPDTAVKVAKSEGLKTFLGDKGKSGGAFQLYTGGGMGNDFQKETGLDPLDPKNEKATIDYALKHVPQTGWTPFHGAARVGIGPHDGIGMPSAAPQAAAFSGTPADGGTPPAVQAINDAMRPQSQQVAQNTPVSARGGAMPVAPMPQPNGSGIYIDPSLVQKRPQMSPQQMQGIMASPVLSSEAKAAFIQQYQQQNQPIEVPYQGGKVIIDPNNPTRQQFVAPEIHWGEKSIGDIKGPIGLIPNGQGGITQPPITRSQPVGPQSQAAPTAAPGMPPAAIPVTAQNAPAAPAPAPSSAPQATAFAAQSAEGGVPGIPSKPIIPVANPQSPTSPFEKFAQNMPVPPGSGIDPQDWNDLQTLNRAKVKNAVDEDSQKKAADFAAKRYDTQSTQAQAARTQAPNLDLALAMMNDPNIHQGLLHGVQDTWSRFKAAALGDKYANAPNEAFDKLMSGAILGNMKTALGGLGQVRLAEINLLTKANANRNNTDASNRAVLEVSRRSINTLDHLDQMGQEYASGGEVHDPITGETLLKENAGPDGEVTPRHGLDVGYDKLARQYVKDHPSFTPEEIKHYQTIFDTGRNPDEAQQPTEEGKGAQGAPAVGTEKQFKQGVGVWNGTDWVPKGK